MLLRLTRAGCVAYAQDFERLQLLWWYSKQPVFRSYFNDFRVVGRGGFGLVWAASHEELGRTVAIKSLDRPVQNAVPGAIAVVYYRPSYNSGLLSLFT